MEDDLKNTHDRIGDRQMNCWKHQFRRYTAVVILLGCLIIGLAYTISHQYQDYVHSFAQTKVEVIKKFNPIPGVPKWKLIITTE